MQVWKKSVFFNTYVLTYIKYLLVSKWLLLYFTNKVSRVQIKQFLIYSIYFHFILYNIIEKLAII